MAQSASCERSSGLEVGLMAVMVVMVARWYVGQWQMCGRWGISKA